VVFVDGQLLGAWMLRIEATLESASQDFVDEASSADFEGFPIKFSLFAIFLISSK